MLQSVRKQVAVGLPRVSVKMIVSISSLLSFAWLLTQDHIHPVVVYLLQLYLAF
jgi:hypothetical protein